MTPSPSPNRQQIDLEAAAWLVRRDAGLTPAEQDEFLQWLAADPRHGEWLAIHQATWSNFNLLAQWRPEHSGEPNPDLLARPRRRRPLLWPGLALAAAAAVVAFLAWHPVRPAAPAPAPAVAAAPAAADHRELADGTVVELNQDSLIEVAFSPAERRVRLVRGEAHFTVVHNAARPFFVTAGDVTVRDIGTAFDVRLDARSVEVLVTEGSVQINPPAKAGPAASPSAPLLQAGQRATVLLGNAARLPQVARVTPADMDRVLAWKPHLLDFFAAPLGEVVAAFNRSNRMQLVIGDRELNALPIVASFRSDNVEGFVRLLEATAAVRVERRENEIVLHRAP